MSRPRLPTAIVLSLTLAAALALGGPQASAVAREYATERPLRMNEIQVIATHNSYKRELPKVEQAAHDALYGGAPIYDGFLAYSHASRATRLARAPSWPAGRSSCRPTSRRSA